MEKKTERKFKGVWIPREIWLDTELSLQEKVFLVEIDSLDNDEERQCWASNQYFGNFFGLSEDRTSKIISELKNKGYLQVEVNRNTGKSCRKMRVTHSAFSTSGGRRKQLVGIGENADHSISNTDNNTEEVSVAPSEAPLPPKELPKIPGVIRASEYVPDHKPPVKRKGRPATDKQMKQVRILKIMDYFRDKAMELHRLSYMHRDEDRNAKIKKQVDSAYSRFGEETRAFIDWWFAQSEKKDYAVYTNYEPEACFTGRVFREYENRSVIAGESASAYPLKIEGLTIYSDEELAHYYKEQIIYAVDEKKGTWGLTPKGKEVYAV